MKGKRREETIVQLELDPNQVLKLLQTLGRLITHS
jgi:hypothetical protein